MSFRTDLLAAVNAIRGAVPRSLDLRQHVVTVRVRTWTGTRSSVGTTTDVDTVLTTGDGVSNPKVKEVSSKDIVASGGLLTDQDVIVGPFTPEFAAGGIAGSVTEPATTTTAREVYFKITGPGMPTNGRWFKRVTDDTSKNFSQWLTLRSMGTEVP